MFSMFPVNILHLILCLELYNTGGPRNMREIGTPKIGSHIMNLHIKRPRITVN